MIRYISFLALTAPGSAADRNAVIEPSRSYVPPSENLIPIIQRRERVSLILTYT
jgi:hypothetical protein